MVVQIEISTIAESVTRVANSDKKFTGGIHIYHPTHRQLTLTATGDTLISQHLSMFTEPAFLQMVDAIRSANVRFTNLEMLIHKFEGYPAAESGGTWVAAEPAILDELKWLGFNLYAWAQNHALDWGEGGLFATLRNLDAAGLVHAGVGANLAEARRPAYLDLDQGRVALISMSSTFANFGRAGHSRPDVQGRPGLNPLRFETTVEVDADTLATLQRMNEELKLDASQRLSIKLGMTKPPEPGTTTLGNLKFKVGESKGVHTVPHRGDAEGNLRSIRDAKRQADWVVVSIHSHEMNGGDLEVPAEFYQAFARECIDAGADIIIGHGPHVLRGIELYEGVPIFYSLGNFVFQNETIRHQPADFYERVGLGPEATPADVFDARASSGKGFPANPAYWESVIPHVTWDEGRVTAIRLYPIDLGFGQPRAVRGRPQMAGPDLGRKIIEHIDRLSAGFGTRIRWSDEGYGSVEL
jgi:poly-gamma-glutamate capsule biosynthesis protein CapA/YwtB (metallophosphatase superfamily)